MSPQPRGVVPPEHIARLTAARAAVDEAQEAYCQAIADALNAGASVRELAKLLGIGTRTVQTWGREHGWPDEELLAIWRRTRVRDSIRRDLREPPPAE